MAISEDSIAITHFVDLKEASTKILKIIIVKIIKGGGKKPLRKFFVCTKYKYKTNIQQKKTI